MNVYNERTAHEIVRAWTGHRAASHLLAGFANDQRHCANLARQLGRSLSAENHLRAAAVIDAAVRRI